MKKFFVAVLVIGIVGYCGFASAAVEKVIDIRQNVASDTAVPSGSAFPQQGVGERSSMAACQVFNQLVGIDTGTLSTPMGTKYKYYLDPEGDGVSFPGCGQGMPYPFLIEALDWTIADAALFGLAGEGLGTLVVEIDIECPAVPGYACGGPGATVLYNSGPLTVIADDTGFHYPTAFPVDICIDHPVFVGLTYLSWDGDPSRTPAPLWLAGQGFPEGYQWRSTDGGASWAPYPDGMFDAWAAGNTLDACTPEVCVPETPANDECVAASGAYDGNNAYQDLGANDSGPDHPICGDNWDDVWYEYAATCSGIATVTANAPDRLIFVYDACPTGPADEPMVCAADTVDFFSAAGSSYWIRIGRTSGGGEVCGSFDIVCLAGCANNGDCDDGSFCTGEEICDFDLHPDPSTGLCLPGPGNPCLGHCDGDWAPCQYDAECVGHGGWEACIEYQDCDDDADACVSDVCWSYMCTEAGTSYFPSTGFEFLVANDHWLEPGMEGGELVYYDIMVIDRNTGPFNMTTELYTNHYICDGDGSPCLTDADCVGLGGLEECLDWDEPYQPIAGTQCSFTAIPSGSGTFPVSTCDASAGLAAGIVPPAKFWMIYTTDGPTASFTNAGPAGIGYTANVWAESYDGGATWPQWWWIGPDAWVGYESHVCTDPVGVCCYWVRATGNTCDRMTEDECIALSGTWTASPFDGMVYCEDPDGDGIATICEDNCPNDANPGQEDCNGDGEGDICETGGWDEEDLDGDGQCNGVDPCPYDNPDDTDLDTVCDSDDECPTDPNKSVVGQCGCFGGPMDGFNQETDSDGDGYADCVDACPGVDDDEYPGCDTAIPTVSEWGLVILGLLLLVAGKVYFGRRARA